MHHMPTLSHADAQRAVAAIQAELARTGKTAVIAVADVSGELVALLRLDGAPLSCVTIATHKAFTAARERKPTRAIGRDARDPEKGFDIAYFGDPRYVGWGGGVPVVHQGAVIGAVAVSGLPEDIDAQIAEIGVQAILKSLE